jgi:arylsulfatase A-like enzyme
MGIMRAVLPPWRRWGMPPEEKTLAELLAGAGYRRRGIVGKWHLGHASKKYHPLNNGFTYFYGHYNGMFDYWTHEREGETDWHRNWDTLHEEGYSTDLMGADAARFIRESPPSEPFLLYLAFNAPHTPLQAPEADVARFAHVKDKRRRTYCAMVAAMDRAVGQVLDALDDRGPADDTFLLFFADNGGVHRLADNGPLRAGKATVYEGGIRVCAAVRWPAGGLKGGTTVDAPIGYIDVYPTVKRTAGLAEAPDPNPLDGIDVLDVLCGRAEVPPRDWFSYIHQSGPVEQLAVTRWPHKLVVRGPGILAENAWETSRRELFDLRADPNETADIAGGHPDLVRQLWDRLRAFRGWTRKGVPAFGEGRQGFKAPKDWIIPD